MNLAISFRSELFKTKRTAAFYLCLLVAAVIPVIFLIDILTDSGAPLRLQKDPWNLYAAKGFEILAIMFLPLFAILLTTLQMQIEFRNNTWKQVYASPQTFFHIATAKMLVLHVLVLFFLLTTNVFLFSVLLIGGVTLPQLQLFSHNLDWGMLARLNMNSFVLVMGIISVQFFLSMRFRNFIVPLGIGFALWFVGAMLGFEMNWKHIDKFPHAFTMLQMSKRFPQIEQGLRWWSVGYAVLFFAIALLDLRWKRSKT